MEHDYSEHKMSQIERLLLRSSSSEDTSPEMGVLLGHALAMDYKTVVIAKDFMKSSTMMKEALVSGILSSGSDVIDLGCTTAPATAMAAKMGDCAVYVSEHRDYGMISGYLLINTDGSLFRRDQIRHLNKILSDRPPMPDYRHLGTRIHKSFATEEYNERIISLFEEGVGASVVLDCGCGTASESAPQILNAIGIDVITINAQIDQNYMSRPILADDTELGDLEEFVNKESGYIGIAMNKIGTLVTLVDENGRHVDRDKMLALMIMYLRPKKIVVPVDITTLIEDALFGRIDCEVSTPHPENDPSEIELVLTNCNAGAVCSGVADSGAELGYYDGGVVFGDISMMADGIYTAAILAQLSRDNSINKIIDGFPEYYRDSEILHIECGRDEFTRMIHERIQFIRAEEVIERDGWKANMGEGWFIVRFADEDDSVEIVAESKDRAYLVGLMEIAGDLVDRCSKGQ